MRISIELIPRDETQLLSDAALAVSLLPGVDTLNVPDLLRFPLRSWEACVSARKTARFSIPHLRAIDIAPGDSIPACDTLIAEGLTEILVVRGDPPSDLGHITFPNTSASIIRRIKRHYPQLKVYGAIDPYRRSFRSELVDIESKLEAGADGFFTQPFFDLRLLEIWAELLSGQEIFWGIAPILGDRSRAYWETTNHIVLPEDFVPDMTWNRAFAKRALQLVRERDGNAYLMPIKVNLAHYLMGLLD